MSEPDNYPAADKSPNRSNGRNLPDLTMYGYRVSDLLSACSDLGRFSYLAREIESERLVVLKEWRPFNFDNQSLCYDRYLPEIERLQQLDHPNIPKYLKSFATETGFMVVREFQAGNSLADLGQLPPADIKLVGDGVLKILSDLHHLQPSVIHHNLKPENIIVDTEGELEFYLVDLALYPERDGEIVRDGEFLPPEQLFDLDRIPASDLHSLGVSLISSLTGTSTSQAAHLFDDKYRLNFKHLVPEDTDPYVIAWLESMVEQNRDRRQVNIGSNRHRLASSIFSEREQKGTGFMLPAKRQRKWWRWAVGIGSLLALGVLLRLFVFPDSDSEELSPAQIAKNQEIAKQAEFVTSDRGRFITDKRCAGCNLNGLNFAKADLNGAIVPQSTFNGTNFEGANLSLAIFRDADLSGANLTKANLQKAAFYGTKFAKTNLMGANLSNAKLVYAKFNNSSLRDANLTNADLKFAELQYVNLRNANLTGADLSNADLSFSNLRNAKLTGAKLTGTNFSGATMPDGSTRP
jgi:uncharacterized protein YjbI with pentapeptide repeats